VFLQPDVLYNIYMNGGNGKYGTSNGSIMASITMHLDCAVAVPIFFPRGQESRKIISPNLYYMCILYHSGES